MIFVFRNNTIEPFFGAHHTFSGYDDISVIPDAESYIWWYQLPLKFDTLQLADEVNMLQSKLEYVVNSIATNKAIYIFVFSSALLFIAFYPILTGVEIPKTYMLSCLKWFESWALGY